MIPLEGLVFLVTYRCGVGCDHCFFETRNTAAVLPPSQVTWALRSLSGNAPLRWVHFSGGEPFLAYTELLESVDLAKRTGVPHIGTVTHGGWATTEEEAYRRLSTLANAGLDGLCVSADAFHQRTVPLERVRNVVRAMKRVDFSGHSFLVACQVEGEAEASPLTLETERILREMEAEGISVARVPVRGIGFGSALQRGLQPHKGPCEALCTCLGPNTGLQPRMVYIDPYGNVQICYGLTIGNLRDTPLSEIVGSYSPQNHPFLKELDEKGVEGVVELARSRGDKRPEAFSGKCDACFQSRKALRSTYPELLRPHECYPGE